MKSNSHTILIVDDEPDIREILKYNFKKENYRVYTAENGKEALKKAKKHHPDIILLDLMMPELNGMETCVELRKNNRFAQTLIVFLTARNEDYSEIAGFEAGADDYITKPIRPKALLARVKSLLKRRKKQEEYTDKLNFSNVKIDRIKRQVLVNNENINLPKMEFDLLFLLASHPEKVYSREEIYDKLWGANVIVGDRTLDVHIRKLRKNIGKEYIKTSKGIGYSFTP